MRIKTTLLSVWGKILNAKKAFLIGGLVILAIFGISRIPIFAEASDETTNLRVKMQKLVQEVAMAYYRKGVNIQYDTWRRDDRIAPEQITSQNISYMVCSGFTAAVYKEAFDVNVPTTTQRIKTYSLSLLNEGSLKYLVSKSSTPNEYKGNSAHGEIVYYTDDFHGVRYPTSSTTATANKQYRQKILDLLEPGDIISVFGKYNDASNATGHAMLVYKIVEKNGKRVNAVLLDSNGQTIYNNNNIVKGIKINEKSVLINDSEFASSTFKEGTIYTHYLFDDQDDTHTISDDTVNTADFDISIMRSTKSNFTILRPLWNVGAESGTISDILCGSSGCFLNEDVKSVSLSDLSALPSRSLVRMEYPGIQIEKTVDVHSGSSVSHGDKMTYSVTIKNNSSQKYSNITVKENVDTDLVEVVSMDSGATKDGGTITWSGISVAKGATKTIKYTVEVKDGDNYGQTIESTGTVANIASTTINNSIVEKLTSSEKNDIKTLYNQNKSKNGIALIKEVYKNVDPTFVQALNDVDLAELLGYQYDKDYDCVIPSGVVISAEDYGEMLVTPRRRSAKYTYSTSINDKPVINSNNIFSAKVFNNYYSMLYDNYALVSNICVSNAAQMAWQRATTADGNGNPIDFPATTSKRSERQVRIYPETLQTGDVLLYRNNNDTRQRADGAEAGDGEDDSSQGDYGSVTPYWERRGLEDGFYAYVFIENGSKGAGFYGGTYSMRNAKVIGTGEDKDTIIAYGTGTKKYERFISADNTKDSDTLQSIFSKDYYVILRPTIRTSQIVSFADPTASITKTIGGEATFTNVATTNGDGTISYESSNTNVATVNSSGKVTIRGGGEAKITATASKTFKYALASKSYTLTVNKNTQTVSFAKTSISKYLGDAPFTNAATTTGDGAITYKSNNTDIATVDENTGLVTIVGVGKATITATAAESNTCLSASKSYTLTVTNKPSQTISFTDASVEKYLGDAPFTNAATTTGDGTITYSSDNTNIATVDENTGLVTIVGLGSVNITATAAETANYASASYSYTLTVTTKQIQTVAFVDASVQKTYGDTPFTNAATTTGDGTITYSSGNTNIATVDANTGLVTIVNAGSTIITATASETDTYAPASESFILTIEKANQTITFDDDSVQVSVNTEPFINAATTNGGGIITYNSDNTDVAMVNEETGEATIVSAGTATIAANATETGNYKAASSSYTLTVNKLSQTVSFKKKTIDVSVGDPVFTNLATTTGDGRITYSSSDTNVASVDEDTGEVTINGAGAVTITASAAETRTYSSANDSYTIRVHESGSDTTIVFLTYDANGGNFPSDSQTTVSCTLENDECSIIISDLEPTMEGYTFLGWSESNSATEYAYKSGDTIMIENDTIVYAVWLDGKIKEPQVVTFADASVQKTINDAPFTNTATTTGDGTITYSSDDTNVAMIDENTGEVTIVGTGTTIITATAAETEDYDSASESYTLVVYDPEVDTTITLIYDANGGNFPSDSQTTATCVLDGEGCSIVISKLKPTREGYLFLGWSEPGEASEYTYRSGDTITLAKDTTIYAVWSDGTLVWLDGSEYTVGGKQGLIVLINHPLSAFKSLLVDGKTVDTKYYTAESGSTVITISPEYLDALSVGKHSIRAIYDDDVFVASAFTIKRDESSPAPSIPDTGANSSNDKGSSVVMILGMPIVAVVMAVWLFSRKKRSSLRGEIILLSDNK